MLAHCGALGSQRSGGERSIGHRVRPSLRRQPGIQPLQFGRSQRVNISLHGPQRPTTRLCRYSRGGGGGYSGPISRLAKYPSTCGSCRQGCGVLRGWQSAMSCADEGISRPIVLPLPRPRWPADGCASEQFDGEREEDLDLTGLEKNPNGSVTCVQHLRGVSSTPTSTGPSAMTGPTFGSSSETFHTCVFHQRQYP